MSAPHREGCVIWHHPHLPASLHGGAPHLGWGEGLRELPGHLCHSLVPVGAGPRALQTLQLLLHLLEEVWRTEAANTMG